MIPAEAFPTPADLAEAQLQEELRGMFAVDTQQYLEAYFSIISTLSEAEWVAQIQELYRCIHTIKGGAVTVGADAVLQVAISLEDLLSDLRCLQTSPELQDGYLAEVLQEAGELLTASVQIEAVDVAAVIAPTLERLQVLHQAMKQRYLPEWNENQQLFQEFADQGFDLVVLDLEIALEGLPKTGKISKTMVKTAQSTLGQLEQIGQDLELAAGWQKLVAQGQALLLHEDSQLWREFWPVYLQVLKDNARQGGQDNEVVAALAESYPLEPTCTPGRLDISKYVTYVNDAPENSSDLGDPFGFDFADSGLLESLLAESSSVEPFPAASPEPDILATEFLEASWLEPIPEAESQLGLNSIVGESLAESESFTGDFLDSFLDPELLGSLPLESTEELAESDSAPFELVELDPPSSQFRSQFDSEVSELEIPTLEVSGFEVPEFEVSNLDSFEPESPETFESEAAIAALNISELEASEFIFPELALAEWLFPDPIPTAELVELTVPEPETGEFLAAGFIAPELLAAGLVDLDDTIPEVVDLDPNLVPIDLAPSDLTAGLAADLESADVAWIDPEVSNVVPEYPEAKTPESETSILESLIGEYFGAFDLEVVTSEPAEPEPVGLEPANNITDESITDENAVSSLIEIPEDYQLLELPHLETILEVVPDAEMMVEAAAAPSEVELEWSIDAPAASESFETEAFETTETSESEVGLTESEPIGSDFEWVIDQPMPEVTAPSQAPVAAPAPALNLTAKLPDLAAPKSVQIPVPLERLDRSAQHLIETLMSARTTQGMTQKLQAQLIHIHALSQDSIEFVTELRQLQDNYTLLNDHQDNSTSDSSGLALERYRQGYLMINRLLEANLRLFELGAEAASSAQSATHGLQTLERNLLNLQQTIEESRLVLFKNLAVRARAIVRDLTTRIGKPAQLRIYGEQLELDANTAQSLEPVLLHLLRNAYDHGLETPEQRSQAGKTAQGHLTLSLQRRGSSYLLELKDDGGGIDPNKIAQIAQSKGLALTDTSSSAKLLAVICQPGFSSQTEVSDISGRGVGMDVVVTQITALGGKLNLDTKLGQGTTFRIQLPVPQLLVRCVLVRAGNMTFALPADDIVTTTMTLGLGAQPVSPQATGCAWQIPEGDKLVPGLDLWDYWSPQSTNHQLAETAIALRIESQTAIGEDGIPDTAWLLADDLLEQADLLITPLPEPMMAPLGVMGVSLQADGKFIPVLDSITLAEYLAHPEAIAADPLAAAKEIASNHPAIPVAAKQTFTGESTILVVDDAALVRRRIEASLSAAGYVVHTCVDGLDAWNWLQTHTIPSLVITDIEMPNMDGFTLINRCRQAGMDMPMLVVSSRVSEDWGREARRLGATDYLTKGFTTPQLLEKVGSVVETSARTRTLA